MQVQSQLKEYKQGNLCLVLDRNRVVPNDPGADTPAMVYYTGKYQACATYWCAVGEGELEIFRGGFHKLTQKQINWLDSLSDKLEEFLCQLP